MNILTNFIIPMVKEQLDATADWLKKSTYEHWKEYRIRKCLSLEKTDCAIILPTYIKKLHNQIDDIPMCPLVDVESATNIMDLIHTAGLPYQKSIIYENTYSMLFAQYNVFCIGGSLANRYSYDLFQQFFPTFKLYATLKKCRTNPNKIPSSHFIVLESKIGFRWGNSPNDEFLVAPDERYAIIVKLTKEDFKSKKHGTVYILFGNGVEGTLAISKYLLFNYKDLNKLINSQKHCFVAFKVKTATGIIDTDSFLDLTNQLFCNAYYLNQRKH